MQAAAINKKHKHKLKFDVTIHTYLSSGVNMTERTMGERFFSSWRRVSSLLSLVTNFATKHYEMILSRHIKIESKWYYKDDVILLYKYWSPRGIQYFIPHLKLEQGAMGLWSPYPCLFGSSIGSTINISFHSSSLVQMFFLTSNNKIYQLNISTHFRIFSRGYNI
jgi:hypothetical protein